MIAYMKGPFRLQQIIDVIFWIIWAVLIIMIFTPRISAITDANYLMGFGLLGFGVYVADKLRKKKRFFKEITVR